MSIVKVLSMVLVALVFFSLISVFCVGEEAGDPPIRIDSDEEFETIAEQEGWDGNGSSDDPWVIEGYEIDGSEYGYGIFIGNVSGHFRISGCRIHNSSDRIDDYFLNSGIYIYNSENGVVSSNIVVDNLWHGIYVVNSKNINISENEVQGNLIAETVEHGVQIVDSENVTIESNEVRWTDGEGVGLEGTNNSVVRDNLLEENSFGVYLEGASMNEVFNNIILKNGHGVYIERLDDDNEEQLPSEHNRIYHNDFVRNGNPAWDSFGLEGENQWDDGTTGNYWSDYRRKYPDENHTAGTWDTPYEIPGVEEDRSLDRYPLVEPMKYDEDDPDEPEGSHPVWLVVFGFIILLILLRAGLWARERYGVKVEK
ncbi:MAG: right-handed parallel beta-helix repeat-containing protein [Candidatus Saliniplasma sp.]